MEFISKLLQRKSFKSGGGAGVGNQPPEVVLPAETQAASAKENITPTCPVEKDSDKLFESCETTSITTSSEELADVPQSDTLSTVRSVHSYPSLPDLLLPEAAYKKQPDTDTDTGDYESAADTYESATETDHSEAITPGEKCFSQVFDEDVKVQEVSIPGADFGIVRVEETPSSLTETVDHTSDLHLSPQSSCIPSEHTLCQLDTSVSVCDVSTCAEDLILCHDEVTVPTTKPFESSLCETFSRLCLDTPDKRTSKFEEAQQIHTTVIISEPSIEVAEEDIFSAQLAEISSETPFSSNEEQLIKESDTPVQKPGQQGGDSDSDALDQSVHASLLGIVGEETKPSPDPGSLNESKITSKVTESFPSEASFVLDIDKEKAESASVHGDLLAKSFTTGESPVADEFIEEREHLSSSNDLKLDLGHPLDSQDANSLLEDRSVDYGVPSIDSLNTREHSVLEDSCQDLTETETILDLSISKQNEDTENRYTLLDDNSKKCEIIPQNLELTTHISLCPPKESPDNVHVLVERDNGKESKVILPTLEFTGAVSSHPSEEDTGNSDILVEGGNSEKAEIIQETVEVTAPVSYSPEEATGNTEKSEITQQTSELTASISFLTKEEPVVVSSTSNETRASEFSVHGNQLVLCGGPVETSKPQVQTDNIEIECEVTSETCHTRVLPLGNLIEGKQVAVNSAGISQDLVQLLEVHQTDSKDQSKLDKLFEICNRQQEDLNQTESLFDQQTTHEDEILTESEDILNKTSSDDLHAVDQGHEVSALNQPTLTEESVDRATEEKKEEFEDIALEASRVAEEIFNLTLELELEPDTETHSAVSSRMSESEDSSLHTSCPTQSKAPLQNQSLSQNEKHTPEVTKLKATHVEVNQSEAGPDIAEVPPNQPEDVFKDGGAFDFLSTIGGTPSGFDLRKQSLYVKFDPLVEPVTLPDRSKLTPPEASREQVSLELMHEPDKARELVEKLISITPTPKKKEAMAKRAASVVPKQLFSSEEEKIEVPCSQEQSPEKQASVAADNKEAGSVSSKDNSSDRGEAIPVLSEADLEMLRKVLKENTSRQRAPRGHQQEEGRAAELRELQDAVNQLEEADKRKEQLLAEKMQSLQQMSLILEEYEKTISRLVAEKEHEKQALSSEIARVTKEKDIMSTHLENIEIAFSDVHQKYEKSKQVIQGFIKNEEALRASLAEYESTIKKQEQKYDVLKSHAMAQLESANEELNAVQRNHELEISKLRAMLRKSELKVSSLEEALEQKTKENRELVVICDELIGVQQGSSQPPN